MKNPLEKNFLLVFFVKPLRRRYRIYCTLDGDGWAGCRVEPRDEPVHLLDGEEEVRHLGRRQLAEPRHATQRRHKHVTCGGTSTWPAAAQARDLRRHKHVTGGDTSTWPAAAKDLDPNQTKRYENSTEARTICCGTVYRTHTKKKFPEKRTVRDSVMDLKRIYIYQRHWFVRRNLYYKLRTTWFRTDLNADPDTAILHFYIF